MRGGETEAADFADYADEREGGNGDGMPLRGNTGRRRNRFWSSGLPGFVPSCFRVSCLVREPEFSNHGFYG